VAQVRGQHGLCRSRHLSIPVWLEMGSTTSQGINTSLHLQLIAFNLKCFAVLVSFRRPV